MKKILSAYAVTLILLSASACAGDPARDINENPLVGKKIVDFPPATRKQLEKLGAVMITIDTVDGFVIVDGDGREVLPCGHVRDGVIVDSKCSMKGQIIGVESETVLRQKAGGTANAVTTTAVTHCRWVNRAGKLFEVHDGTDGFPQYGRPCHDSPTH